MNAKRVLQTVVIPALFVILLFGGIAAAGWGAVLWRQARQLERTPAVPTPAPSAMPSGGAELTVLASGSGVTVLEYQGAGVRCIIASDGAGVDMVCQNSATVPVQPPPTEQPKHQVPNGSSEA